MAFTVTFPTTNPLLAPDELEKWLTEQGEPCDPDASGGYVLRALPVRFVLDASLQAQLEVGCATRLTRLVDLLFALSNRAGADVKLMGTGIVTRSHLWMLLADEQDRLRIADAIERAAVHGNQDDVLNRLWRIVAVLRPGHDDRWDAAGRQIVELQEVGGPDGLTVEEAAWHRNDPDTGDVVAVPVRGQYLHTLAWRWLSESYPGLTEASNP